MNGKDIRPSRCGFVYEIVVSGLYSGDIAIGEKMVYKYTWARWPWVSRGAHWHNANAYVKPRQVRSGQVRYLQVSEYKLVNSWVCEFASLRVHTHKLTSMNSQTPEYASMNLQSSEYASMNSQTCEYVSMSSQTCEYLVASMIALYWESKYWVWRRKFGGCASPLFWWMMQSLVLVICRFLRETRPFSQI